MCDFPWVCSPVLNLCVCSSASVFTSLSVCIHGSAGNVHLLDSVNLCLCLSVSVVCVGSAIFID